MSDPILQFENITFAYPQSPAPVMQGLHLPFSPGSVTAILGPNGAGKTTLLHLALGWLTPQAGHISLEGKPLSAYSRSQLGRRMSLVPQSEHVPFEYSLLEYVLLGRAPYLPALGMPQEDDYQVAGWALEQVGMSTHQHRSIMSLSGGERQLVLIARALAQQPRLLLLDEPSAHLDLSNKYRLASILEDLCQQGISVILTTHEPDLAGAVAGQLVLMREGRVLSAGALQEVMTSEHLSATYDTRIRVREVDQHLVVLWH